MEVIETKNLHAWHLLEDFDRDVKTTWEVTSEVQKENP